MAANNKPLRDTAGGSSDLGVSAVSRQRASRFNLTERQFPDGVLNVVKTLYEAGHEAYIVGGGVRDFMLGCKPKDFDVATSAHPEQVAALFPKCRLIGRRFRLAHVRDPRNWHNITEVATFRALLAEGGGSVIENRRIIRDNTYGSLEEDILRRDFTINSMYYNPFCDELVSHRDALADIAERRLRSIGDPWTRYHEDPVRMLRAIRFMAKLDLQMDDEVSQQIHALAPLIRDVPSARLFDESIKLFHSGGASKAYDLLREYKLFKELYPGVEQRIDEYEDGESRGYFLRALLANTDRRIAEDKPVTPAFVMAALFWLNAEHLCLRADERGVPLNWHQAISQAWAQQQQYVSSPRRLVGIAREICLLQRRLESNRKKHLQFVIGHPRFRAAYDFLCLRADSGMGESAQADWWTQFQEVGHAERRQMMLERSGGRNRTHRGTARKRKTE